MNLSAMTRYLIPTILLALIAALLVSLLLEPSNSGAHQANKQRQSPNAGTESATQETAPGSASRTKSKIRIQHPKPTLEETVELLKSTIVPKVDILDQPLSEVTAKINTLIKDAGIPSHKLKVVINSPELFAQLRIKELRIRNIPLSILLKYICDNTKIRYRVEPGIVIILSATEIPPDSPKIENPDASNDPFANSSGPTSDPFAEPGSTNQVADPFAEPTSPTSPESH
jgi:hypothetical protein